MPESPAAPPPPIDFLDLSLPTLEENLALDEALLLAAEAQAGGEVLRLWRWPQPAVVLGAGGVVGNDVLESACVRDGVPLARRSSGGGTVLLGPGCLLYSLVLDMGRAPELTQIGSSYRFILDRVAIALREIQPIIEMTGTSDLAVAGRKVSGNAQQRKRRFVLHHGTLLHGLDIEVMGRYLKLPPRRPEYRGDRPHGEFLTNLPDVPAAIGAALRGIWRADRQRADFPAAAVRDLVADKYGRPEWVRRL
jgi:lipoate---protein ligase